MTAQADPYVRVYYRIIDDPRFEHVYDDDRALATWLRLLLTADAMHPAPAPIPVGVRKPSLDKLVAAGLVDTLPGGRYRFHGLAAERARQSARGRAGAVARWESERNAAADTDAMRTHTERNATTKHDAMHSAPLPPLRSSPSAPRGTRAPDASANGVSPEIQTLQGLAEELTGQAFVMVNTHSGLGAKTIHEHLDKHGLAAVVTAWRTIAERIPSPTFRQLVLGADDLLNPVPRGERVDPKAERAELLARLKAATP